MYYINIWHTAGLSAIRIGAVDDSFSMTYPKKVLLNLSMTKSMQNPIGTWSAEVAPIPIGMTGDWLSILKPNSMVEIYKRDSELGDILKMQGFLDTITYQYNAGNNTIRYTLKGSDMGKFFVHYFNLLSNKYLLGSKGSSSILREQFKEAFAEIRATKQTIPIMAPMLFQIFSELFQKQMDPVSQAVKYIFSDGENVNKKWGEDGKKIFEIAPDMLFQYPLWVDLFRQDSDNVNFWSALREWVSEDFNDMWTDTADGKQKIPIGGKPRSAPAKGFHIYIRPTLNNVLRLYASTSRILNPAKIVSCTLQKTNTDLHTIFTVIAAGSYKIGEAYSQGIIKYYLDKVKIYGQKLKVATIKNVFNGHGKMSDSIKVVIDHTKPNNIWQAGSQELMETYGKDDELLSGSVTAIDCNFKIGQKLEMELPKPQYESKIKKLGKENIMCLINGISEKIDYTSGNPKPIVTMNVTRGILIDTIKKILTAK